MNSKAALKWEAAGPGEQSNLIENVNNAIAGFQKRSFMRIERMEDSSCHLAVPHSLSYIGVL